MSDRDMIIEHLKSLGYRVISWEDYMSFTYYNGKGVGLYEADPLYGGVYTSHKPCIVEGTGKLVVNIRDVEDILRPDDRHLRLAITPWAPKMYTRHPMLWTGPEEILARYPFLREV